jgi:hypothetical protein
MPPTFVIAHLWAQQAHGYTPAADIPARHRAVRRIGAIAAAIRPRARAARRRDLHPVA